MPFFPSSFHIPSHRGAVDEAAPWTPADTADLAIFFWFKEGNCLQGPPPSDVVTLDNPIHYVSPLFGTTINAASDGNPPTLRADGMELDAAGVARLVFSSQFSATDITVYWSIIKNVASSVACFASDTTQQSLLGGMPNISIIDNIGDTFNSPGDTGIVVMGRFNMDAAGNYSMISTDAGDATGSVSNNGFDFNQIGGTGAIGVGNDSTDNRFRLLIAIKRSIALGSAEDLRFRNWIATHDGASL